MVCRATLGEYAYLPPLWMHECSDELCPSYTVSVQKKGCGKRFSVREGTVIQDSKLSYQIWALAIYIIDTGIKGVSSVKLHRDLDVTQKTAWYLAHRLQESWNHDLQEFDGPVEVDEAYIGGLEKNKHEDEMYASSSEEVQVYTDDFRACEALKRLHMKSLSIPTRNM